MGKGSRFRLSSVAPSLKVLITCVLLTLLVGYAVAVIHIYDRTHFEVVRTLLYYRGAEGGEMAEILVPPSFRTLLSVAHVHTMTQPILLAVIGLLFALSRASEVAKVVFILFSFGGSLASNLAPWLIRYLSPRVALLLPVSQMLLLLSFLVMAIIVLRDLWFREEESQEGDYV